MIDTIFVVAMAVIALLSYALANAPEIVATLAGVKENKRVVGLAMIIWKKGGGFEPHTIGFTYFFAWIFVLLAVIDIITFNSIALMYNVVLAYCYFRLVKNYKLGNSIIEQSQTRKPR